MEVRYYVKRVILESKHYYQCYNSFLKFYLKYAKRLEKMEKAWWEYDSTQRLCTTPGSYPRTLL